MKEEEHEHYCFICMESTHPLITPCLCKASRCHQVCLQRWINASTNVTAKNRCLVCLYSYEFNSTLSRPLMCFTYPRTFFTVTFFNYLFSLMSFFIFYLTHGTHGTHGTPDTPDTHELQTTRTTDNTNSRACYTMEFTFMFLAILEWSFCTLIKRRYKIVWFPLLLQQRIQCVCILFLFCFTLMFIPLPVPGGWCIVYIILTMFVNCSITSSIFWMFIALEHKSRIVLQRSSSMIEQQHEPNELNIV
jgi:hypothetical protein